MFERSLAGFDFEEWRKVYRSAVLINAALLASNRGFLWINNRLKDVKRKKTATLVTGVPEVSLEKFFQLYFSACIGELLLAAGNLLQSLARSFKESPLGEVLEKETSIKFGVMEDFGRNLRRWTEEEGGVLKSKPGEFAREFIESYITEAPKLLWIPPWFGIFPRRKVIGGDELPSYLEETKIVLRNPPAEKGTPWRGVAVARIPVPQPQQFELVGKVLKGTKKRALRV